jgi:pectin methylesterase-like acyl-CoA thioesterase
MAKKGFLLGVLAMALTFGLVLTGCPLEQSDDRANAAVPDVYYT